jgi:hypothetical protein
MRNRRINVKREMKIAIQMKINILMEEVRVKLLIIYILGFKNFREEDWEKELKFLSFQKIFCGLTSLVSLIISNII